MRQFFAAPLFLALVKAAHVARDAQPCHTGTCEWTVATENGSGVLRVLGSETGISDLTRASGWTILDCDASAKDQEIRVACHNPSGCEHLYRNGAEHTLVRLPEECGTAPFALVKREWDHEDQSIPASKRSFLARRDGTLPTVKGMSLTMDPSEIDPERHGDVTFFAELSTNSVSEEFRSSPPVYNTALTRKNWVRDSILTFINETNKIDQNATSGPHTFDLESDDVSLFNRSASCPAVGKIPAYSGGVNVGVKGKISGMVNYGAVVAGTLVPANITDFALFVELDALVDGTLDFGASLTGTISTGRKEIVPALGIPGLGIEGVLALGPFVTVYAEADLTLGATIDLDVDLSYNVTKAQLFFPPSVKPNGTFEPGDSGLQLSASPSVPLNGQLTAHIIPSLAMGINLLDGFAETAISLDLDASASLDLSFTGTLPSVSSSTGVNTNVSEGGCIDVSAGFSVEATADADLEPFFDKGDSVPLYSKTFDLFNKCFGSASSGSRKRATNIVDSAPSSMKNSVLSKFAKANGCSVGGSSVVSVIEEKLSGSSLMSKL